MLETIHQAQALANMIEDDPQNDAYDALGITHHALTGYMVAVNDTQATAKNPDGRAFYVTSWEEWEQQRDAR